MGVGGASQLSCQCTPAELQVLLGVFASSASSQAPPFFASPIFHGVSWGIIPMPLPMDHLPSKCALNLHITEDLPPGPWNGASLPSPGSEECFL